jgi:hypothetical protein
MQVINDMRIEARVRSWQLRLINIRSTECARRRPWARFDAESLARRARVDPAAEEHLRTKTSSRHRRRPR